MRILFAIFLFAIPAIFPPLLGAKTVDPFAVEEGEEDMGWDQVYVFPIHADDVNFYDKSRPFPEILRKFSEQPGYIWTGPAAAGGAFPLTVNDSVKAWIGYWSRSKGGYKRYLRRSGLYSDMINHELSRREMPRELFYLCMIESGFDPKIKSWAGARGLWQFIRGTGRKYGLQIDYWVDERCDPQKSTDASLNYLSDLYGMFGDWHLAVASYNTGEDFVARRMKKTGCKDYWCLCEEKALVAETRDYVPKIISAAIVGSNLERYGIHNVKYLAPLQYSQVTVHQATDLRVAARCSGANLREIEFLNPELNQFCTPPNRRSYKINIPAGRTRRFYAAYNKLGADEKEAFKKHKVKKDETIRTIAYSYETRDTKMLAKMNNIKVDTKLRPGQTLVVPVPRDRKYKDPGDYAPPTGPGGTPEIDTDYVEPGKYKRRPKKPGKRGGKSKFFEYTIEPDDTLWSIARWSGTSVDELKKINNIKDTTSIQYGDTIKVPTGKGKQPPKKEKKYKITGPTRTFTHIVRPGDRCYLMARHYGIHSVEIIKKNKLDPNCSIRPGQKLTLVVPKNAPKTMPPTAHDQIASLEPKKKTTTIKTPGPKGKKKITYIVETGDSLWWIARKHDTHVADVKKWNGLESDSVHPGQKLVIYPGPEYDGSKKSSSKSSDPPKSSSSKTKKTSSSGGKCKNMVTYIVQPGDSLWLIARKHDAHCTDIMAMNNMESESIQPGRKLKICPGSEYKKTSAPNSSTRKSSDPGEVPKARTSTKGKKKITYIVKEGDSLWLIARNHDVHVVDVKAWNKMSSDSVRPGQKLIIYVEK